MHSLPDPPGSAVDRFGPGAVQQRIVDKGDLGRPRANRTRRSDHAGYRDGPRDHRIGPVTDGSPTTSAPGGNPSRRLLMLVRICRSPLFPAPTVMSPTDAIRPGGRVIPSVRRPVRPRQHRNRRDRALVGMSSVTTSRHAPARLCKPRHPPAFWERRQPSGFRPARRSCANPRQRPWCRTCSPTTGWSATQLTDADRRGLTPLFWTHVALRRGQARHEPSARTRRARAGHVLPRITAVCGW